MPKVDCNYSILKWARESSNLSIEEVASKMNKEPELVSSWENGSEKMTYIQLEKLAYNVYKRPIAVFFFPEKPDIEDPNSNFRTFPDYEFNNLSYKINRLIRKGQAMQLNLEELFEGINPSRDYILKKIKIKNKNQIENQAEIVREELGISLEDQNKFDSSRKAFKKWREAIEKAGVFVFKEAFKDNDISGFCLYDDEFPVIYINNSLPYTRQIFSLFHELAHLFFNLNGIDKINDDFIEHLSNSNRKIEVFCNKFAGAFLVPDNDFDVKTIDFSLSDNNINSLANIYSVSREVILRKLFDRGIINNTTYEQKAELYKNNAKEKRNSGSGGNYYYNVITYLGEGYIETVLSNYYQNKIDINQTAEYLDVKPKNVSKLETYVMS